MAIELVATVVPKVGGDDGKQHIYVYITPRISYSGIGELHHFKHIYNWPDYFEYFRKAELLVWDTKLQSKISCPLRAVEKNYRGEVNLMPANYPCGDIVNPGKGDKNMYARRMWRSMFDFDVKVDGWELEKTAFKLGRKLATDDLKEAMDRVIRDYKKKIYTDSFEKLGIPDVSLGEAAKERIRRSLLDILNHLLSLPIEKKLASPYIHDGASRIVLPSFLQDLQSSLKLFSQVRNREIDDLSFKLSLEEVRERNTTETNEFHKKMTAYANFPFLLKQTGWIWEYEVSGEPVKQGDHFFSVQFNDPVVAAAENAKKIPVKIKVDKEPVEMGSACGSKDISELLIDFHENISILSPFTATKVTGKGKLDYRFKEPAAPSGNITQKADDRAAFSYLKVKEGYIQNDEGYSFQAELIEKNQQFDRVSSYLEQKYEFKAEAGQPIGMQADNEQVISKKETLVGESNSEFTSLVDEKEQLAHRFSDFSSCGIALKLKGLRILTEKVLVHNPGYNRVYEGGDVNEDSGAAIIYGHNLHKGYRVDVISKEEFKNCLEVEEKDQVDGIRSLCKRRVMYAFLPNKAKTIVESDSCETTKGFFDILRLVDEDEGWILESMQGSKSQKLYVDEELFRWNDWSLCTDSLAKGNEQSNDNDQLDEANIRIRSLPIPGSLPTLRFGKEYDFCLRFVDICGGGFSMAAGVVKENRLLAQPIPYDRVQGVSAPLVVLGHELHKGGDRKNEYYEDHYGEDLVTLTVRSEYRNKALVPRDTTTTRFIGPPKLDFNMVKKHEMFDKLMSGVGLNGFAGDDSDELLEFTSLISGLPNGTDPENTNEEIMKKSVTVGYLYDPTMTGFDFKVNGRREFESPIFRSTAMLYYKEAYHKGLTLRPGMELNDYRFTELNERYLEFILQQGREKDLTIECAVRSEFEQLIKSKTRLKLIHAVEKPCLLDTTYNGSNFKDIYKCDELEMHSRKQGGLEVTMTMYFDKFPSLTTETFILHACYIDKVPDRRNSFDGVTVNEDGFRLVQVNKIIKTGIRPDRFDTEIAVYFSQLAHTFNDTRSRKVFYKLEAVSKFKRFFPAMKVEPKNRFSIFGFGGNQEPVPLLPEDTEQKSDEKSFHNYYDKAITWATVRSSAAPPVPVIDRIVPLIRWENKEKSIERKCDTVRVYFQGDWYTSGDSESVAVFFIDSENAINSANVPKELEGVISQLGSDPISTVCSVVPVINEKMLSKPGIQFMTDLKFVNIDFENRHHVVYAEKSLKAGIYPIQFMPSENDEDGKYYIDISIDNTTVTENMYFPFLRFALARYQENTIDNRMADDKEIDLRFSKPMVTDFVQLLPYRKLTVGDRKITFEGKAISVKADYPNLAVCRVVTEGATAVEKLSVFNDLAYNKGALVSKPMRMGTSHIEWAKTWKAEQKQEDIPEVNIVVEEYEQYESRINVKEGELVNNDFRKRLVFSYTFKD